MQPLHSNPKYVNMVENSTGKSAMKRLLAYQSIFSNSTTSKLRELKMKMGQLVSSAGKNSSSIMRINIVLTTPNWRKSLLKVVPYSNQCLNWRTRLCMVIENWPKVSTRWISMLELMSKRSLVVTLTTGARIESQCPHKSLTLPGMRMGKLNFQLGISMKANVRMRHIVITLKLITFH